MTVYLQSLGCDKNLSDSEHMLGLLAAAGYDLTDDEAEADVLILNTCCFIGDAKEESIQEILRLADLKKNGKAKVLITAGCLSERYQKEILSELPEIDGCVGIGGTDRIAEAVREALEKKRPMFFPPNTETPLIRERVLTTGGHFAYLKIAEGCSKNCAYCVIPKVRGPYRSVPMEELLREAEDLVLRGVKELILVAQETTLYGVDLYGKKSLPELLRRLAKLDLSWIRLLYCYPEEITDELVRVMKEEPKILPYLDIPIQHASDAVLKRMGRRTTEAEIRACIEKLRREIPGLTLRTTLITGFPGETEEDVKTLLKFVKDMRFDRLGVFPYSPEEGTKAYDMPDQIDEGLKKRRRGRVMRAQQKVAFEKAEEKIGKTVGVLIEGRLTDEPDTYVGRTEADAPDVDGLIFLHSPYELNTGDLVNAKVTASSGYDLIGELSE